MVWFIRLILAILLSFFAHFRTDGFRLNRIESNFEYNSSWDAPFPKEVKRILDQPFFYLSRGRQCFVFQSKDEKYVIKFFNHNRFRYPYLLHKIPLPSLLDRVRKQKEEKQKKRFNFYFSSYKLAFEELSKETGIECIHLNKTQDLSLTISIFGKYGEKYSINLDDFAFIVQKKTIPIFEAMEVLYKKEGKLGMEKAIDSFVSIIRNRCLKKIADDDVDVGINFGFIGYQAIAFDCGRLFRDDNLVSEKEMKKSTKRFRKWLLKTHPDEVSFFDGKINR